MPKWWLLICFHVNLSRQVQMNEFLPPPDIIQPAYCIFNGRTHYATAEYKNCPDIYYEVTADNKEERIMWPRGTQKWRRSITTKCFMQILVCVCAAVHYNNNGETRFTGPDQNFPLIYSLKNLCRFLPKLIVCGFFRFW